MSVASNSLQAVTSVSPSATCCPGWIDHAPVGLRDRVAYLLVSVGDDRIAREARCRLAQTPWPRNQDEVSARLAEVIWFLEDV